MHKAKRVVQARLSKSLQDHYLRQATRRGTDTLRHNKEKATLDFGNWEKWRTAGEAIRTHVIANLDYYLKQLIEQVHNNGGHVEIASTPAEAVELVRTIIKQHHAQLIIKSKSMVSEEIHLNQALQTIGQKIVETDLGEFIIQLAGEPPSHIIAPALHKNRDQIARLFEPLAGHPLSSATPALTSFAREKLRQTFLAADIGITGCNFAIANTGSIVLVTNEGNGRMVSTLPPIQITLMGMERILPSFRELGVMLNLLGRSATGQRLTSYTSILTPPRQKEDQDGPREFHLIILDHNRSRMLANPELRPALRCIRCGACFNVCPVYRQIGGHAYGSVYAGPIGAVITPILEDDWNNWGHLPYFSSLCGACSEACPVKIPLHGLLIKLRELKVASGCTELAERQVMKGYQHYFSHARRLRRALKWSYYAQRPFIRRGRIVSGPPPLSAWTKCRTLAPVAKTSFMELWPMFESEIE